VHGRDWRVGGLSGPCLPACAVLVLHGILETLNVVQQRHSDEAQWAECAATAHVDRLVYGALRRFGGLHSRGTVGCARRGRNAWDGGNVCAEWG
jgi:hypothetical protein